MFLSYWRLFIVVPLAGLLFGCAVIVPPVDVTRVHAIAASPLAPGTRYRLAADSNAEAGYILAVERELAELGLVAANAATPAPLAIRVTFDRFSPPQTPATVTLTLAVRIDDAALARPLWDGRAVTSVPLRTPAATGDLAAAKMADALFRDFPGTSGATITVP